MSRSPASTKALRDSQKLRDILGISLKRDDPTSADALFVGGNDYPAEDAGVISHSGGG